MLLRRYIQYCIDYTDTDGEMVGRLKFDFSGIQERRPPLEYLISYMVLSYKYHIWFYL